MLDRTAKGLLKCAHMQIYLDESGNLGEQGKYFVIACLIPPQSNRLKNLVKRCRVSFGDGQPLDELKGFNLTFEQRQYFLNRLVAAKDFGFAYIVADKRHLRPGLADAVCYNYLTGHLLKPIIKRANENVEIICDNRNIAVASGNSLKEYLQIKAAFEWGCGHIVTLRYLDSSECNHLQCVDVISNTVYGHYALDKSHCYRIIESQRLHGIHFPYQKFGSP